jgi:hypothetical protein
VPPSAHVASGSVAADTSEPAAFHGVSGRWENAQQGPPLKVRLDYTLIPASGAAVTLPFDVIFSGASEMTAEVAKHLLYAIHCARTFAQPNPLNRLEMTVGKTLQESDVKVNGQAVAQCSGGAPNTFRPLREKLRDASAVLSSMKEELAYHVFKAFHASNPSTRTGPVTITVSEVAAQEHARLKALIEEQANDPLKRPTTRNGGAIPDGFQLTDAQRTAFNAGSADVKDVLLYINGPMCYGSCAPKVRDAFNQAPINARPLDIWFPKASTGPIAVRARVPSSTDIETSLQTLLTANAWTLRMLSSPP